MPPTPVDDHTEEFEQLAGVAALGALEGDEQARFEEHAARCERCRLMVQLDQEALARAAPEMDPSPDFKARLMQRAATELAGADARATAPPPNVTPIRPASATPIRPPEATPLADAPRPVETERPEQPIESRPQTPSDRPPGRVIPLWRRSPRAWAIAALLVLGLFTAGAYSFQNQVVASYTLSGAPTGSAVVNVRRSGAAELNMSGVQNPPPGYVYEAWIIPPNGQPVAAGTAPTGTATLPLSQLASGTTVAVTQEQRPVDAPTSAPIMAVVVQS